MVSGAIKHGGTYSELPKTGTYYKVIELNQNGTFEETCGDYTAKGTYVVEGSQTISYSYTDVSGSGPSYFAMHDSGSWMYRFWDENTITIYDYTSQLEVSMTFIRMSQEEVDSLTAEKTNGPIAVTAEHVFDITHQAGSYYNIYLLNPRLYASDGPSIISNPFRLIEPRLHICTDLGCDVLCFMPIYREGKNQAKGSPYCVAGFREVDPAYGDLSQLRQLVAQAHNKGMKVMFDWVANHTAWDCLWIEDHPEWYEKDASGNIVSPDAEEKWSDVAQLDYANRDLWEEMTDAMLYWINTLDIDGYRCIYSRGPSSGGTTDYDLFWKYAINAIRKQKPGFIMLADGDDEKLYDCGFDIVYSSMARLNLIDAHKNKDIKPFLQSVFAEIAQCPEGHSRLFFVTDQEAAAISSPVQDFMTQSAARMAFLMVRSLPASNLFYGSQEIAYPSPIDYSSFLEIKWNENVSYQQFFNDLLKSLDYRRRDENGNLRPVSVWAAGPVAILAFGEKLGVAINISSSKVTVRMPKGAHPLYLESFTMVPESIMSFSM